MHYEYEYEELEQEYERVHGGGNLAESLTRRLLRFGDRDNSRACISESYPLDTRLFSPGTEDEMMVFLKDLGRDFGTKDFCIPWSPWNIIFFIFFFSRNGI